MIYPLSPMAFCRLVCVLGHQFTDEAYRPTIVRGRVLWHLSYTKPVQRLGSGAF